MLLRTRTEIREIAHAISLTAQDTSNVTINVYKNYRYIPRKQLKLKLVVFFGVFLTFHFRHRDQECQPQKVNCTSLFQNANLYYRE
jgi:hypothetical protein